MSSCKEKVYLLASYLLLMAGKVSAFLGEGISKKTVDMMIDSISNATLKQYESHLKSWWHFAHLKSVDFFNLKTLDVINFLNIKCIESRSYNALNTARSAISLITTVDLNSDGLISCFMKEIFRQRPTKLRYTTTLDVTPVLYLESFYPIKDLKLRDAAEKVAILLVLTTAQKLQTLSLININNILRSESGISIIITKQIKTLKPGAFQPELILPFYSERPR